MIEMLIQTINAFFLILTILIFVRVIISFAGKEYSIDKKVKFIFDTTEPILAPIRKFLNKWQSELMLDFSPIIALILLDVVNKIIIYILAQFI